MISSHHFQRFKTIYLPIAAKRYFSWFDFSRSEKVEIELATLYFTMKTEIHYTMLKKLSKCKVKVWLSWDLIILLPLRFYMKSNFGEFKQSKNVIFDNFRDFELWILVNLGLERCSHLLKIKIQNLWNCQNNIFGLFEFAKTWFHAKSEWR